MSTATGRAAGSAATPAARMLRLFVHGVAGAVLCALTLGVAGAITLVGGAFVVSRMLALDLAEPTIVAVGLVAAVTAILGVWAGVADAVRPPENEPDTADRP